MHGIKERVDHLFHRKMETNQSERLPPTGRIVSLLFRYSQITDTLV